MPYFTVTVSQWRSRREGRADELYPTCCSGHAGHFHNNPGCSKGLRPNSVTGLLAPRQNRPPCRQRRNYFTRFVHQSARAAHGNSVEPPIIRCGRAECGVSHVWHARPTTNLNQMRGRSPCVLHEPLPIRLRISAARPVSPMARQTLPSIFPFTVLPSG